MVHKLHISETETKLKKSLYGITVSSSRPDDSKLNNVWSSTAIPSYDNKFKSYNDTTIVDPPGYLIKMVLTYIYRGRKLPKGGDKSEWELPISYRGHSFIITDSRRRVWQILYDNDSSFLIDELVKKFINSAKILGKHIDNVSKAEFESGNMFLYNSYNKTIGIYEYFVGRVKYGLNIHNKSIISSEGESEKQNGADTLNKLLTNGIRNSQDIHFNLIAACIFFFAATEILMDICFSLGDRKGRTYNSFRQLNWEERFKMFFDLSASSERNYLFQSLKQLRQHYRNTPVHASPARLFLLEGFGLIPSDYAALNLPAMSEAMFRDPEEAEWILMLFDRILEVCLSDSLWRYSIIYAKSGLCIPIDQDAVKDLKFHMKSFESFEQEIRKRSDYQDAIDNMDI